MHGHTNVKICHDARSRERKKNFVYLYDIFKYTNSAPDSLSLSSSENFDF
jgi:hypothetical protein